MRLQSFPAARLALAAALAFALAAPAPAQDAGYRLRPGDVLRIEVVEDAGLNRNVLVAPDGRITVPLAGSVAASGRTVETVQAELATRLAASFATAPTVFVSLDRVAEVRATGGVATIDIHVIGEAAKTGRVAVKRGTTLLQAFSEMGGFSRFAAVKRVQLRRGGKIYQYDYTAIEAGTSNAGDTVLQNGDVILVPQRRLFE
jgi:polysaccharide export outer membrane protein